MTRNQFEIDRKLNFQYIFGVSDNIAQGCYHKKYYCPLQLIADGN